MKIAQSEQFLADLGLDWPDFNLKGAKISPYGAVLARIG
jgi:hypothetical protein